MDRPVSREKFTHPTTEESELDADPILSLAPAGGRDFWVTTFVLLTVI